MNRLVALALSFLVVLSSWMDLRDLTKFATLLNHYRQAHDEISLLEFMDLHYGPESREHDKEHGHKSLPFKSHERTTVQSLTVVPPMTFTPPNLSPDAPSTGVHYRSVFISEFASSIWQPPRIDFIS